MDARHRVQAQALGRASSSPKMEKALFGRSAVSAPAPRSGEVRHTALPDTFDGIRFEIGRMDQYVKDSVRDPAVRRQAAEIQGERPSMGAGLSEGDQNVLKLQAIDDWCRLHARYVNDPPNIEVIQTPGRMVKQTKIPAEVIQYLMTPFYDAFTKAGIDTSNYSPSETYIGDCDELVTAMTGLSACTFGRKASMNGQAEDDARFFFQFGGNEGTLHHVWSKTVLGGTEFHADHTEPGYKLGDHSPFDAYEDVEVLV